MGLTGGIACGKSTVLRLFRELGVTCFEADALYGDLVEPGTALLNEIITSFGEEMLHADGSLNRAQLASLVFRDEYALKKLNQITHPAIMSAAAEQIERAADKGARWAIFEAAILLEAPYIEQVDLLVVVSAPEEIRAHRVMNRNALPLEEAKTRIKAQASTSVYESKADLLLQNSGKMDELKASVHSLYESLVAQLGTPSRA